MGKNVRCIPRILILSLPVNTQGYVVSISTGGSDRQSYFLVSWWTTKYCVIKNPHASREISFQIPLQLEELREHFRNTQRDASEQCSGFYRPVNGVTQNGMFLCVFVWLFLFFLSHTRIFIRQYNMPTVVSDFRGRNTNPYCTGTLHTYCLSPPERCSWLTLNKTSLISLLVRNLTTWWDAGSQQSQHSSVPCPRVHRTEPQGSSLQSTTKSSQSPTPAQCFLSVNAFHPMASFTSRLGLRLYLLLPRIKSLLYPPTW